METIDKIETQKGGEWLIKEGDYAATFISEEYNEEQQMVKDLCRDFLDTEVMPIVDRIDKMEPGLMSAVATGVITAPASSAAGNRK